jgi:hypothetical protein
LPHGGWTIAGRVVVVTGTVVVVVLVLVDVEVEVDDGVGSAARALGSPLRINAPAARAPPMITIAPRRLRT